MTQHSMCFEEEVVDKEKEDLVHRGLALRGLQRSLQSWQSCSYTPPL